jgi:hypothetical protein
MQRERGLSVDKNGALLKGEVNIAVDISLLVKKASRKGW